MTQKGALPDNGRRQSAGEGRFAAAIRDIQEHVAGNDKNGFKISLKWDGIILGPQHVRWQKP